MRLFEFTKINENTAKQRLVDIIFRFADEYLETQDPNYPADQANYEAEQIRDVATAFATSARLGVKKFYLLDTELRDDLAQYLTDNNFNVDAIRFLNSQISKKPETPFTPPRVQTVNGTTAQWQEAVREVYPDATFRQIDRDNYNAYSNNKTVGTYYKDSGTIIYKG